MRRTLCALFMALVVIGLPAPAEACGGLFCTNTPVDQAAERIIFAVNHEAGEITAYVQINYTGDSDNFSWVVPVPSNPEVNVAEITTFDELSQQTAPQVRFPPAPDCWQMPVMAAAGGSAEDGVNVLQQGSVGPYDFAVVEGGTVEMVAWLRDNGYRILPEMEPLIDVYSKEGMVFLAMKLSGGKGTQDIQPVAMTYKSEKPMIPLRLTAVAANPNMAIVTWIFADMQATPSNMPRLQMRNRDIAMTSQFGASNYNDLRTGVLDSVKGQGFVIEYAQPSSNLSFNDELLQTLAAKHPYLTRYYGEMSPEEMILDPMFEFNAELPNVSNIIDLTDRNTPYDCESGEIHSIRRQQYESSPLSPEAATKDLKRGPLRIVSAAVIVALFGLIFFLVKKGPRRAH